MIIKFRGFLNGGTLSRFHTLKSNLSIPTSSFAFQFFTTCLKQTRNWSSFLPANQHGRLNRINPTNPKALLDQNRIESFTRIQLNSKTNYPKPYQKINNNLKAWKSKEKREEKGQELLSRYMLLDINLTRNPCKSSPSTCSQLSLI